MSKIEATHIKFRSEDIIRDDLFEPNIHDEEDAQKKKGRF